MRLGGWVNGEETSFPGKNYLGSEREQEGLLFRRKEAQDF
jgi:hypothetical protein